MPHQIALDVHRLKHEHCSAIDDGRYREWASSFTDDGRFVRGSDETIQGHEALYEFASESFDSRFETAAHCVNNPVIDVDGGEATGRWYLQFFYETPAGEVGWTQGRFEDEYRRVDGEWRVAASRVSTRLEG